VYRRRYESRPPSKPKLNKKNQNNKIWRKTIFNMAYRIITPKKTYDHDIDVHFPRWQHPAVWQVALGWHAIEFAQTSAILEFYTWFRFWPYHRSRHVILRNFIQIRPPPAEKMTSCRFSRWRISAILDFRGPIMRSLKSQCTTSCNVVSIEPYSSKLLSFWENRVFATWWQTDKQTDEQTDTPVAWSRSRCRERRLNNKYLSTRCKYPR